MNNDDTKKEVETGQQETPTCTNSVNNTRPFINTENTSEQQISTAKTRKTIHSVKSQKSPNIFFKGPATAPGQSPKPVSFSLSLSHADFSLKIQGSTTAATAEEKKAETGGHDGTCQTNIQI